MPERVCKCNFPDLRRRHQAGNSPREVYHMQLKELLPFDTIVIQCHNDPDADAIASGYGIFVYLQKHAKKVRLIYGGAPIRKANLVLMTADLGIPIEHITTLDVQPDLLLTVDCQYGEKNVQHFSGKNIAVIDHHMVKNSAALPPLSEVRSSYGACAVIIWDLLCKEGFPVSANESLSTALYYGLFMDTNRMQELRHPMDRDLRDALEPACNQGKLFRFQNCNLSLSELKLTGQALSGYDYYEYGEGHGFAIVGADECDPNILGIISDMLVEVDIIDVCVVYCMQSGGVKLSIRSCVRETKANELAAFLTEGLGNGGGHIRKSGGFLEKDALTAAYRQQYGYYPTQLKIGAQRIIAARMEQYFLNQDVVYAGSKEAPDLSAEPLYQKKQLKIGYVRATDMYPAGTRVEVRMLEGDQNFSIDEDTFFIIGAEGEVYINKEAIFQENNEAVDAPYQFHGEYAPLIHKAIRMKGSDEEVMAPKNLTACAKTCITKPGRRIHARCLKRMTKVVIPWSDSYLLGMPGDYLAARQDNLTDIYIIKKNIFLKTYEPVISDIEA